MKRAQRDTKKKLTSIPVINRRLFRFASIACRNRAENKCEVCGKADSKVDAHHCISRSIKDTPLKWDVRNLVALCPYHHKFGGSKSAHGGLWFAKWFEENRKADYDFITANDEFRCDLRNRVNLTYIEECLTKNKIMDYANLK